MKKILSLLVQDTKLLIRNALFWVVTATLVIIVLVVHFLIPGDFDTGKQSIVSYNMEINHPFIVSLDCAEAVNDSVKKEGTVGFIQEGDTIKLIHPGLSEKAQNAIVAAFFGEVSNEDIKIVSLRENTGKIPGNIRLTPVFICFEALISGFLMAGILLLEEKEGKTIKAYRVSPAGTIHYVCGKMLLFSIMGTVYSLLLAVLITGFQFEWISFILLAFLSSALFTLFGLSVTVFFRDISSWFSISIVVLTVNMLTMVSYSSPSFSPAWIRLIPSYPIIFGFEEVLFGTAGGISDVLFLVLAEASVLFVVSCALVNKVLLKSERSIV